MVVTFQGEHPKTCSDKRSQIGSVRRLSK